MKVLTTASFYGSGSSAIADLLTEYSNVFSLGNYEIRILHDIDGVSDLEYHLCENPNRHNSGHSLKRFKKLVNFYHGSKLIKRYEPYFQNRFLKISNDYITRLTDFSYKGWWFYDLYDRGRTYYFLKQLKNHFIRLFTKKTNNILKSEETLCPILERKCFIEKTKEYTHKLLLAANKINSEYIEIDQLVPSQNINRVLNYFKDEVFVFVVDRDPRDIFISELEIWHECVIPHNVSLFCKWYRYTHKIAKKQQNDHVFYINFEDLIFNYEKVVAEVENVTGLNSLHHSKAFKFFNPKVSSNNTQLFKKYKKYDREIKYIEENLREYLFDFDGIRNACLKGLDVESKKVF